MDQAFIAEMKQLLEARQAELVAQLKEVGRHSGHDARGFEADFPEYGDKEDENASEVATFSDNLSLERTLDGALEDVRAALTRIAAGKYGQCRYCGQDIDQRRLRARPESGACIQCKAKYLKKK
jgi:DnaK suppressor protein